jgi:DNA-binding MarR family transcriptional regulator
MPENNIPKLISIVLNMRRLVQERMRSPENGDFLSMSQLEILSYVSDAKRPVMKDIADFLKITPPSATALIDNLVRSGQLRRTPDKHDRRIIRLSITAKGRQKLKKDFQRVKNNMKKVFSELNKREINNLINTYKKLANVLKSR